MTTHLDKPVSRLTAQRYQRRPVILTMSPATPANVETCTPPLPERVELRLQGTQQKPFHVPMDELFRFAMRRAMSVRQQTPHDAGVLLVESARLDRLSATVKAHLLDHPIACAWQARILKEIYALQGTTSAEVAKKAAVERRAHA